MKQFINDKCLSVYHYYIKKSLGMEEFNMFHKLAFKTNSYLFRKLNGLGYKDIHDQHILNPNELTPSQLGRLHQDLKSITEDKSTRKLI